MKLLCLLHDLECNVYRFWRADAGRFRCKKDLTVAQLSGYFRHKLVVYLQAVFQFSDFTAGKNATQNKAY